jgi:hypothetical protein
MLRAESGPTQATAVDGYDKDRPVRAAYA